VVAAKFPLIALNTGELIRERPLVYV